VPMNASRLGDVPQYETYEASLARLERDTVRDINQKMRGQDFGHVHAALASQLEGRFPGVEFDQRNLKRLASAIARGTLVL
jgi:hypothetical protein